MPVCFQYMKPIHTTKHTTKHANTEEMYWHAYVCIGISIHANTHKITSMMEENQNELMDFVFA